MKLEDILIQFGNIKGLGRLSLNPSGTCYLTINDSLIVSLEKSIRDNEFYLYSTVGQLPAGREKEFSLLALSGNLFGRETGHASLGYVPNSHSLVLFERFEEDATDIHSFCDRFGEFLSYLTYWTTKLEEFEGANGSAHMEEKVRPEKNIFFA
jgi:hypothetical protein